MLETELASLKAGEKIMEIWAPCFIAQIPFIERYIPLTIRCRQATYIMNYVRGHVRVDFWAWAWILNKTCTTVLRRRKRLER